MIEQKIRKLKRVVIKEELVALTGKVIHSIVLNQMIEESNKKQGWFLKTANKMRNECINIAWM